MAIYATTCYAAKCDFCDRTYAPSGDSDEVHYQSEEEALGNARDSDWEKLIAGVHIAEEGGDKLACEDCRPQVEHSCRFIAWGGRFRETGFHCEICWAERNEAV